MKKHNLKRFAILFASILLLTVGCTNKNTDGTNNNSSTNNTNTQQTAVITETEARRFALEKAGLETATFIKQEYDSYDNEYEFEFYVEDKVYDCDVSSIDGTITNFEVEYKNY